MNRDEILQYIYDLQFVPNYVRKLANSDDWEIINDEIQDIWLQLCEVKDEKWQTLLEQGTKNDSFKAVRGYVSGLVYRNIKSVNSKLYYRLKKHQERELPMGDVYADFDKYESEQEDIR